jgi:hypothetical protein
MTPGTLYAASLVGLSLLIALAVSWPAFLVAAALWLLIALALMWSDRGELQATARDAQRLAADAVAQTEVFADELIAERMESAATHAANEILCAELAASDQKIRRLSNDLLAAQTAASDAENVIPLPVQRDGSHDDLAALDAEASAYTWPSIARDAFPVREWGEEAEK